MFIEISVAGTGDAETQILVNADNIQTIRPRQGKYTTIKFNNGDTLDTRTSYQKMCQLIFTGPPIETH